MAGHGFGHGDGNDPRGQPGRAHSWPMAALEPARAASNAPAVRAASGDALTAVQRWRLAAVKMQSVAALGLPRAQPAPIEWLPAEVVTVVFCLVDAKTLMMTIPLVSGSRELARGAGVGGGAGVGLALACLHAAVWRNPQREMTCACQRFDGWWKRGLPSRRSRAITEGGG